MCGIAGIAGTAIGSSHASSLRAMVAVLDRRGPDDHAIATFPGCLLGHTRLSILDLVTGQQPMRDHARNVTIVFNGEIYNFRELRTELERAGQVFVTRSDTEVILKAYLQYGEGCAARLDGMFAFAIWDEDASRLFLARDRFGKKPLYVTFDQQGNLLFASELKAILASGLVQPQIDRAAMDCYLRLGYVPPDRSIYRNVQVVRPGHAAVFADGRLRTRQYWQLPQRTITVSYAEAKEEVRRLLEQAVARRMVADVEIGALLSGGIDSTIVTYMAQQAASRPIKTFSVGYGDYINELSYAKAASQRIGTDHHELQVGGRDLLNEHEAVAAYFDEPHADTSNLAQCLVSQLARTKVKVALCGDGGDELFYGYEWYWRHWGQGRRVRLKQALFSSLLQDYVKALQPFRPEHRRQLWSDGVPESEVLPQGIAGALGRGGLQAINRFDLNVYLPGQLLVKADRAGMMHSLEVRSPLLDTALAEFVVNLPAEYKADRQRGKVILKDLLRDVMPAEFVDRPKQGFGAPVDAWLRTIFSDLVHDVLTPADARIFAFFNADYVRAMVDAFYRRDPSSSALRIWMLLWLELWCRSQSASLGAYGHEPAASGTGR